MKFEAFVTALQGIEQNRNISQEIILESLEDALVKAFRKQVEIPDALARVDINPATGEMHLYQLFEVKAKEDVEDDVLEVELEEAQSVDPNLQIGDFMEIEHSIQDLGRAAAQLAKQVLKQKVREAEKKAVYDEYIDKLDEMIIGEIESVEHNFILVNLGKAIALMPRAQQIPNEVYQEGQRLRVVIVEVVKDTKGAQVIVSRSDAKLVRRLFEKEVPEIFDGLVEIKAIAREAGERTKMAVLSHSEQVDAIGACIGPRGSRVQVVIEELRGEKIDIFEWSPNMVELIKNALSPAQVIAVFPQLEGRGLTVIVEDSQLSLAIGRKGKNARLAVRLTGQKIDIKSQTEAIEAEIDYMQLMEDYQIQLQEEYEARQAAQEAKRLAQLQEEYEKLQTSETETTEDILDKDELDVDEYEEDFTETFSEEHEDEVEALVEEDVIEEVQDEEVESETIEEQEPEVEEIQEEVIEPETVEEQPQPVVTPPKRSIKERQEYVSKYEKFAEGGVSPQESATRRRRQKDEDGKRLNTAELLKELEYEIKPEYTPEELAEIEAMNQPDDWYDEEIDFDAFDEYYDEE